MCLDVKVVLLIFFYCSRIFSFLSIDCFGVFFAFVFFHPVVLAPQLLLDCLHLRFCRRFISREK